MNVIKIIYKTINRADKSHVLFISPLLLTFFLYRAVFAAQRAPVPAHPAIAPPAIRWFVFQASSATLLSSAGAGLLLSSSTFSSYWGVWLGLVWARLRILCIMIKVICCAHQYKHAHSRAWQIIKKWRETFLCNLLTYLISAKSFQLRTIQTIASQNPQSSSQVAEK